MANKAKGEESDYRPRWNPARNEKVLVPKFQRVDGAVTCVPVELMVLRVNGNDVELSDGKVHDSRYCFSFTDTDVAECERVCRQWTDHQRGFKWPRIQDPAVEKVLDKAA